MSSSDTDAIVATTAEQKRHRFIVDLLIRMVKEKPLGTLGFFVVILLLATGIFADQIAPYGMNEIHLIDRLQPPGGKYLLGTDQLGRDILSNIIYGARVSMIIGLSASALMTIVVQDSTPTILTQGCDGCESRWLRL